MTELLENRVAGAWIARSESQVLRDPVTGEVLVRVSSAGLDLPAAVRFAREQGGAALRAMSFGERAACLARVAQVLQDKRATHFDIATVHSGTVESDASVDIDGAIHTVGQYAKWGVARGDARVLLDGAPATLKWPACPALLPPPQRRAGRRAGDRAARRGRAAGLSHPFLRVQEPPCQPSPPSRRRPSASTSRST